MATKSKHGATLCEIERLCSKYAYMSDGTILINRGDGWKVKGRVKPGFDPADVARRAQERYAQLLAERPAFADYRQALHANVCNGQRYLVHEVLNMLANDPDGVWSELNDMAHIAIDVDECVTLCHLHEESTREAKKRRESDAASPGGAQ